jgi:hypothetical protein
VWLLLLLWWHFNNNFNSNTHFLACLLAWSISLPLSFFLSYVDS